MAHETSKKPQPAPVQLAGGGAPPPLPGAGGPPPLPVAAGVAEKADVPPPPPMSPPSKTATAQAPPAAPAAKADAPQPEPVSAPYEPKPERGEGNPPLRRAARRRPAGPSRPAIAANDDLPSIGGLIFALHQKPSRRPVQLAAAASIAWVVLSGLLGWAMLAPELQRAPTLMEMLTRPTAIVLAATVAIPIALFWFLALLVWRAQELKLMSSAMTEVAIRLAEPDRMAEQQIASVGQAVRHQVSHMNEAVSRALGRASELEALVHNEVASLERSYAQNEHRIRGLLQELAGERHALINTSERVNLSLKELGAEIPTLIDKLGDQQMKLARFIEDAGRNLVSLETSLAHNTGQLAHAVGSRTDELRGLLTDQTQQIDAVMSSRMQHIQTVIADGSQHIEGALAGRTEHLQAILTDSVQQIDGALEARMTSLGHSLATQGEAMTVSLVEYTETMQGVFDTFSEGLNAALGDRTEGLQAVLEEYTRALDQTLEGRQQQLDSQLVARTKALDDAFSERLALFDESILRSTIAIDSMVADKARALSSALETHAKEIGQVLGRQAGELDEQIMHGVHAVRRASENVTRQSLKAIEGLAGQADLLKNVSENLVNQISAVTNRFDQQGQTIMRAANALETANFRIDKTLQNRQVELSDTLDKLSGKAEDIDRVLRGYSTSLEGTFEEAQTRARSVGEELTRATEERSRIALDEFERLQVAAAGETDRALADLRAKFSNVSREVSSEIGSLNARFTDTSEEMRRQAQRTLAEIESEQSRLAAELQRLPEATRASAESMRASLQEQLKALEQLSQLSRREALRPEVALPQSLPPAGEPPSTAAPPPRSISSVTQSLANELASRSRQYDAPPRALPPAAHQQPPAAAPAAPAPTVLETQRSAAGPARGAIPAGREGWSLGDLLARASEEQEEMGNGSQFNVANIARALDATTASAIWSRFRAGQRGVMVRSIYTVEGRAAYDEVQRRYKAEAGFRDAVDRYMLDLEQLLRDADQRDPSGRTAQSYVMSDTGRVYLFLAHASGRLA
jgi:F0F1-type ATP synthase membrane subunit b/b'